MNRFSLVFVCGGTIALALSLVMGWLGVPHMIRGQIKKSQRLVKGRNTYTDWKGPSTIPRYTKFYIFNVTNPDEVKDGGKPNVSEVGPYTYAEQRMKVDIGPGIRNHTIQYRNKQVLHFLPQMSTGSEQDLITLINVPVLMLVKLTAGLEDAESVQKGMDAKLVEGGEGLFKMATVRELLFDGVSVQAQLDILQVYESNDTKIPDSFLDGKYGIYEGRNKVEEIYYEVSTGEYNFKMFGRIEARNNVTLLPWWGNETCNNLNGTDGTIFPPFVTPDTILQSYSPEMCRTQTLIFEKDVQLKGVPGYRFIPEPKLLLGSTKNPENWCYCVDADPKSCERDGILSTAGCSEGAPYSISFPHFYGAEQSLIDGIDGMEEPVPETHGTFFDIEPATGKLLRAARRIQLNVDLTQNPQMPMLSKINNVALPILWMEESTELTDDHLKVFGQIKTIAEFVEQSKWYMIGASGACVGIGVIVGMLKKDKIKHEVLR